MYIKSFVFIVPTSTVTISPRGPLRGVVGNSLDLTCTVSTFTGVELNDVMIMWLDSEDDPLMDDGRVTISPTASIGNNNFASSLSFTYLMGGDISDEGTYTCNVMILDASGSDSFVIESLRGQYALCVNAIYVISVHECLQQYNSSCHANLNLCFT